jgi:hypothetical protein
MVRYWVARTGKPHSIVEDFILYGWDNAVEDLIQCCGGLHLGMAGTMQGARPKKLYRHNPSSNTVSQHISDMAGYVLKQLLLQYKPVNSMRYSWMSQQTWRAWHSSW